MADGLDSLTAMRNKTTTSRRAVPPPRHPPRQTPVQMPEPAPPTPPPAPSPRPVASGPAPMPVPGGSELAKASIYLDEHTDAYLETVRAAWTPPAAPSCVWLSTVWPTNSPQAKSSPNFNATPKVTLVPAANAPSVIAL